MEKCLCDPYSVSYKFFDDDACAISVWELDGRIRSIRIESHLPSQFLTYVLKDKYSPKNEARWSYVEPQYGFCADYYVYWFKIVDRPNLVMNLTLFSKDSWLIEVFPAGS